MLIVPDIATIFYDTSRKNTYNDSLVSYRVSAWLKAVPKRPPVMKGEKMHMRKLFRELFFEWNPNWNYEYNLYWCKREEATHVSGTGIAGCIAEIKDSRWLFTHNYVKWSEEIIEEHRQSALDLVDRERGFKSHSIRGKFHD